MSSCTAILTVARGNCDSNSAIRRWSRRYALMAFVGSFYHMAVVGAYCNSLDSDLRHFYVSLQDFVFAPLFEIGEFLFACVALFAVRILANAFPVVVIAAMCCFAALALLTLARMVFYYYWILSPPEKWGDLSHVDHVLDMTVQITWIMFFLCLVLGLCFASKGATRAALSVKEPTSHLDKQSIRIAAMQANKIAWVTAGCAFMSGVANSLPTTLAGPMIEAGEMEWYWFLTSACALLTKLFHMAAIFAWVFGPMAAQSGSVEGVLKVVAEANFLREIDVEKVVSDLISQDELDAWHRMFNTGAVGEISTLESYLPLNDFSHYRIGISFKGMVLVLERIGFICRRDEMQSSELQWNDLEWTYCMGTAYQRAENDVWLDEVHGAITDCELYGRCNVLGYDLCIYIRRWLAANNYRRLSLVEVVLTKPEWSDLREHIGFASVLWSHLQSEPLLGPQSTLTLLSQYVKNGCNFPKTVWCDYFCLRQACANAFSGESIVEAIHYHGEVVACVEADLGYLKRSFCLLESFAAVIGGCRLQFMITNNAIPDLQQNPVSSKVAQTRFPQDKAVIDGFVEKTVGFSRLDVVITRAVQQGLATEDED